MPVDLEAVKRALAAATPAPWYCHLDGAYDGAVRTSPHLADPHDVLVATCERHLGHEAAQAVADAQLIASAPTLLAELVAEVEALRAELAARPPAPYNPRLDPNVIAVFDGSVTFGPGQSVSIADLVKAADEDEPVE